MSKKNEASRSKREKEFELVVKVVLVLTIIGIIVSTVLIFTPPIGGEEYAELGLLTYNSSTSQYEADNYPTQVVYNQTSGVSNSTTLYFLLGNHYHRAQFFEVRLKIGLQNVTITPDIPGTNENTYFYEDFWFKRVLAFDEVWGPSSETEVTFSFNSSVVSKLGMSASGYKIIFELWQWNNQLEAFSYSGVHIYLTSFQLIVVS
jgi:hypothetical protein